MSEKTIEELIRELGHSRVSVRMWAARALGDIGDASAVPALIKALGDKDWTVRQEAARALGEIKDASAIPALSKVLEDEQGLTGWDAVKALGKIGLPAVPALINALGHSKSGVEEKAADVLWEIGPRNSADLRLIANAAWKAKKEGKPVEVYWKVYFAWSKKLSVRVERLVSDKRFHIPKLEKPDRTERVLRVQRVG